MVTVLVMKRFRAVPQSLVIRAALDILCAFHTRAQNALRQPEKDVTARSSPPG